MGKEVHNGQHYFQNRNDFTFNWRWVNHSKDFLLYFFLLHFLLYFTYILLGLSAYYSFLFSPNTAMPSVSVYFTLSFHPNFLFSQCMIMLQCTNTWWPTMQNMVSKEMWIVKNNKNWKCSIHIKNLWTLHRIIKNFMQSLW